MGGGGGGILILTLNVEALRIYSPTVLYVTLTGDMDGGVYEWWSQPFICLAIYLFIYFIAAAAAAPFLQLDTN